MVSTDLPTPEEFEEAQEAIKNGDPEAAPYFDYWHRADEFDDYTSFMAYVAAVKASRSSHFSSEAKWTLDSYKSAAKGLLLGIGAVALIEAVIGDARL
ncbi:hypothetical protein [Halorubrum salinum]|uniref:hypothetical protein n=1 Tax=Halorubrum salinum TaxID=767517 RepID=UPI002112B113|nr:hypothetical protein [Halorubrum salinum]